MNECRRRVALWRAADGRVWRERDADRKHVDRRQRWRPQCLQRHLLQCWYVVRVVSLFYVLGVATILSRHCSKSLVAAFCLDCIFRKCQLFLPFLFFVFVIIIIMWLLDKVFRNVTLARNSAFKGGGMYVEQVRLPLIIFFACLLYLPRNRCFAQTTRA